MSTLEERPRTRGRQWTLSALVVLVGSVAITLATYWTAIFADYARLDDYIYVYFARTGELANGMGTTWVNAGRPVPALVFTTLLPAIESVEHVSALRLVAALGLSAGASLLGLAALALTGRRGWLEHLLAVGVAGVVLTATASPSAVTWAVMAGQLPALSFAVAAGAVATYARGWRHWLLAAVLTLLAAFTYQHYTPLAFFVAAVGTATLWAQRRPTSWWRPIGAGVLVVSAMVVDVLFIMWRGGGSLDRAGDATLDQRITWFTHELLPRTADVTVPWSMESALWSAVAAGLLLLLPATLGRRFLAVPVAVVVGWACTALILLPGEMWASYRLVAPSQIALWSGVAFAVTLTASAWSRRVPALGVAVAAVSVVAVGLGMVTSHQRAVDDFAAPNVRDWKIARCAMAKQGDIAPGSTIRQNEFGTSSSPVLSYDEYGITASSTFFAVPFQVWLALDAADGPGKPKVTPSELAVEPPTGQTPDAITIPMDSCQGS